MLALELLAQETIQGQTLWSFLWSFLGGCQGEDRAGKMLGPGSCL